MQDYWPHKRSGYTPPPDPVEKVEVNGLNYEECSKYELAQEIYNHRRAMQDIRKAMNQMESAQQRVPYAPARR